jgi:hypothetical protein
MLHRFVILTSEMSAIYFALGMLSLSFAITYGCDTAVLVLTVSALALMLGLIMLYFPSFSSIKL